MMYFGKLKNSNEYTFDIFKETFERSVEVSDEEFNSLFREANEKGKVIRADNKGKPVLVDPPKPSDEILNQQRIRELEGLLDTTDWYVIRKLDTGEEMPADIKKKRQEAREEISRLREELEKSDR